MKYKSLVFISAILLMGCSSSEKCTYQKDGHNPGSGIFRSADEIRIFSYEDTTGSERPSRIDNGVFSVINQKEMIILNPQQSDSLFSILFNFEGNEHSPADCYNPRHTIVLYKNERAINFLEICLECRRTRSDDLFKAEFCTEKWNMLNHFFRWIGIKYGLRKKF